MFGFSLTELIIAMGLIGILAAISLPMISGLMPDKNKPRVLKYYRTITEINQELLDDPAIYRTPAESDCIALTCTQRPIIEPYRNNEFCEGSTKYLVLLADKLETVDDNARNMNPVNLELNDGSFWTLTWNEDDSTISVDIDVDGPDAGNNLDFDRDNINNPDVYRFTVESTGVVRGRDSLTRAYIENQNDLRNKSKDIERAKVLKG